MVEKQGRRNQRGKWGIPPSQISAELEEKYGLSIDLVLLIAPLSLDLDLTLVILPPFFGPSDGTAKLLAKMLRSAKSSWLAATAPTQHTAQCSLSPKHCLPGDLTAKNCGICNWQQQDYNVWQYLADFLSNTPKEIYIRQCFALAICLCMAKTKQILI